MLRPNVDIDAIRFFPPEWYEASGPGGAIDPAEPHSVRRVFDANMQAYYAMIEVIDDNVGRRCHMLERNGIADSTMVALLSDHGERGGSHGKLGKAEPWEESVRVPLIVSCRAPGLVPGGCACGVPVHTEDLFCNLPGLVGGSEAPAPLRVDFAPYILGRAPEPDRDGVLLEFVTETRTNRAYWDSTWRGLRTRNHNTRCLGAGPMRDRGSYSISRPIPANRPISSTIRRPRPWPRTCSGNWRPSWIRAGTTSPSRRPSVCRRAMR
ncbi:MAG: sulfatase-like hydrolase/transferase [Rhodospirillales bacterium]|nr:sulfatase-like hydrolase/transferase [Rhodospirillales bacterium]